MAYSTTAKNAMLDGRSPTHVSLHTADPGATGANEVSHANYARQAATFAAASGGSRAMSGAEDFEGPASGAVTHFGIWESSTFLCGGPITGDQAFNAESPTSVSGGLPMPHPALAGKTLSFAF